MQFFGVHRIALDDKNRMRIPNKFRAKLSDNFIICGGTDGCLFVLGEQEFNALFTDKLNDLKLNEEEKQDALRALASTMQVPEEDAQGRFILQNNLKSYANINKKMVFVGVLNRIEIWSEEAYEARWGQNKLDINSVVKLLQV
ncbi:MAG: division/cell wall cluster transcriptional repressor MraZ [Clostridiales bacterium]|nr:division/cell wall cluster transcriptional repressor MraZ [Clostridiales bacterium]